jgi:hypothetical protein
MGGREHGPQGTEVESEKPKGLHLRLLIRQYDDQSEILACLFLIM